MKAPLAQRKAQTRLASLRKADGLISHGQSVADALRDRREGCNVRYGLLNDENVHTLKEAPVRIENRRRHTTPIRPHDSLGDRSPAPRFSLFVRAIGLVQGRTEIGLANLAYNLKGFRWIETQPMATLNDARNPSPTTNPSGRTGLHRQAAARTVQTGGSYIPRLRRNPFFLFSGSDLRDSFAEWRD